VTPLVVVHVAAGSLALVAGFVAMAATKGGRAHRLAGRAFVGAMVVMALLGAAMAAQKPDRVSITAGLLAFYLVCTAMLTVRPDLAHARRWGAGFAAFGFALGSAAVAWGFAALANQGQLDGMPAPMFFVFGSVALLGALGDARVLLIGAPQGPARLMRHVWRMGFAMFIATGSFFLGQADEFPAALRVPLVMFPPVLLVVGHVLYWLARLSWQRVRGAFPARAPAPQAAR
jgi:hypothetical protein